MTIVQAAFINGELVAAQHAVVSIAERGFRFGDGVFETVAVHHGQPHELSLHVERLAQGLAAIGLQASLAALPAAALQLIAHNQLSDGLLRIYISRGQGGSGYSVASGEGAKPLVVMETLAYSFALLPPVRLLVSGFEKISPKALPVQYKLAQGLQSTLVMQEAATAGADDGLLLNANGAIAETASANIFWLKAGRLFTPSLACGVLQGTTREHILRYSPWPVVEGNFLLAELADAEAVILTNCRIKARAVSEIMPYQWRYEPTQVAQILYDLLMVAAMSKT